jgi:hypothetical protein
MGLLVLGMRLESLSETEIFDLGSWRPVSTFVAVMLGGRRKRLDVDTDIIVHVQLLRSSLGTTLSMLGRLFEHLCRAILGY